MAPINGSAVPAVHNLRAAHSMCVQIRGLKVLPSPVPSPSREPPKQESFRAVLTLGSEQRVLALHEANELTSPEVWFDVHSPPDAEPPELGVELWRDGERVALGAAQLRAPSPAAAAVDDWLALVDPATRAPAAGAASAVRVAELRVSLRTYPPSNADAVGDLIDTRLRGGCSRVVPLLLLIVASHQLLATPHGAAVLAALRDPGAGGAVGPALAAPLVLCSGEPPLPRGCPRAPGCEGEAWLRVTHEEGLELRRGRALLWRSGPVPGPAGAVGGGAWWRRLLALPKPDVCAHVDGDGSVTLRRRRGMFRRRPRALHTASLGGHSSLLRRGRA